MCGVMVHIWSNGSLPAKVQVLVTWSSEWYYWEVVRALRGRGKFKFLKFTEGPGTPLPSHYEK